jgi:uncharacterized protein (DUF2235 family)
MVKNIVFCADGTWCGPDNIPTYADLPGTTNVFKIFCNLEGSPTLGSTRLKDEQESVLLNDKNEIVQVAKYLHGVGDSDNFMVKALGGTLGAGIISRIVRGYTFISRHYVPGDKIFITGFSRGAYTARALAGLISVKGLLDASKIDLTGDPTDPISVEHATRNAYRLGSAVWYDYRKTAILHNNLFGLLEELVVDLPVFLIKPPTVKLVPAPVMAVGVWDTVGALGIPEYSLASDRRIQSMRFADEKLSDNVMFGFHAISIDEQRTDFSPTLWIKRKGIEQRLFAGCHGDVGGGYLQGVESGLSDCALVWMTACFAAAGVVFAPKAVYPTNPQANGTAHQPWIRPPWNTFARAHRKFPLDVKSNIDPSVNDRRHCGLVKNDPYLPPGPYDPKNI